MDISSSYLNSIYGKNTSSTSKADALSSRLDSTDYSKASNDELMEVCKEFESYLVEQMLDAMEKMVPKSDDEENSSTSTVEQFSDMLTQEYASSITESGTLGIAESLYEQMKRNYSIPEVSSGTKVGDVVDEGDEEIGKVQGI